MSGNLDIRAYETDFLLTKIIATLGPATANLEIVEKLILEGVRVFRINFSHGTFAEHEAALNRVRAASGGLGIPVAVLGDLCGPKIRLGEVAPGGVVVEPGQTVVFQRQTVVTTAEVPAGGLLTFSATYPALVDEVAVGQRVLLDDGFVRMLCLDTEPDRILCRVTEGGRLTSHKGINLPDTDLTVPALTDKDVACVEFAVARAFDFLALSFVRSAEDVRQLKDHLVRLGARPDERGLQADNPLAASAIEIESEDIVPIVSKIEKPQAIDNLDEILAETDAVMVARGDLGVEMDLAEVAVLQKRIIAHCRDHGIPAIVATQMLQSMIETGTPTRAEVADVANAIFDGADAVMLSGETAVGKHPVEAVRIMNRIARKSNAYILSQDWQLPAAGHVPAQRRRVAALAHGVGTMVHDLDVKLLAVWSHMGGGAVYLAQQHIPRPILACSENDAMLRRMALVYGLTPLTMAPPRSLAEFLQALDRYLADKPWIQPGDPIAVVTGEPMDRAGVTNKVCLHCVGETATAEPASPPPSARA